ncbi:hypothetical protein [Tianweitania sp.]|uniref:hypothetical protein n=1 Tax=Tianweitania sp. TaxID=2021634 RepID=UPI00289F1953|nr:hypothetical protein [Tianweitania sp.]
MLQNTVNGAIDALADNATLFDAVTAVASVTALNDFSTFEFGGNTYVYGETGVAEGLDAGDTLIQLTGVSLSDLNTASNFVA